jgi:hypothetical protein
MNACKYYVTQLQRECTPALSPSEGERVAEGRMWTLLANPPIVIGDWDESLFVIAGL